MKRIIVFVLAVSLMFFLSACDHSCKSQARNEIYEHMKLEAAADGVDLDALIASEQAAYEERHEEYLDERAKTQAFLQKIEPLLDEIETAFTAYKAARHSAEIISTAESYNNLYREYMSLSEQEPDFTTTLYSQLNRRIRRTASIPECIYLIKAAYADFADKESYLENWCYYNLEENNAYIALRSQTDFLILKMDGSLCRIDLSTVITESTSYIQPLGVANSHLLLYTIDNADYLYFEFPLHGTTAAGIRSSRNSTEYTEWWFDSFESFIMTEMNTLWK